MSGPIRVLVAEDQAIVRGGFCALIAAQADMEVVGDAASGREAVRRARSVAPDVVLMDIRMPGVDGLQATRALAGPDAADPLKVLILTTFGLDEYVVEALRSGASGFLLKDAGRDRLIDAVRTVAGGEALLDPAITRRLITRFVARTPGPAPAEFDELTVREQEVFRLVAGGRSNGEIAQSLTVGENTVKTHVARILSKLALRDRVQIVVYAYEHDLVHPQL